MFVGIWVGKAIVPFVSSLDVVSLTLFKKWMGLPDMGEDRAFDRRDCERTVVESSGNEAYSMFVS